MNTVLSRIALIAAAASLAIGSVVMGSPQEKRNLEPGDKAPGLDTISDWVQGEKPDLNDGVVVVEFWATWCGPCKRAIPHLNQLYKKYNRAGLHIVGVAADENTGSFEQNIKGVKSFLKSKGDGMSYVVAVDNLGDAKRRWMDKAGLQGIPATFVIGRGGKVLWIGHPADPRFEEVVLLALMNKFDPILTPKAWETLEAAKRAADLRNFREAYQQIDEAVKIDPPLFGWLISERYLITLEKEKNAAAARQYLRGIMPAIAGDPYSLRKVVETICKDPQVSSRDLETAMVFAEQMKRASGSDPAPGMAMIALVHATKGELDKAVEVQTAAWLAANPGDKPEFKRVLDEYQGIRTRKAQTNALVGE